MKPNEFYQALNLSDEELKECKKYDEFRPIVKEWIDNYINDNSITRIKDFNKLAKSILKKEPEYTLFSEKDQSLCFDLAWLFCRERKEILEHRRGNNGLPF